MNETEKELSFDLPALQAGDRAEFARLVEAHSAKIYRLGLKMLHNTQDAEDLLQETFIKAYHALSDFEGRSSLSTWLYRIASNEALMQLRRKRPVTVSIDTPIDPADETPAPRQIIDWCCLPESELMSAEARQHLDWSVQQLPETLRVVFLLRDIEGLSTRETAEVLDLSEAAVKTRLSRARMQLRELLSTYYADRLPAA
ncbi:MAG: sigma-70 family RNA polymerase sigma factor [Anaerolineales bacterium]|nr:sigma-70 family RNA polymerase sigma factor [Anaerolineales bacterium]